jgi:RNA polymerase sigma-70 factor (ECF subfamily)
MTANRNHWTTTSPTLLERLRDPRDAAAWRDFDRRYGDLIVRYARSRGLQAADAEDVRQIVLLNLSRALPGFRYSRERGRFRSYLGTVVLHAISRWNSRGGCPDSKAFGLPLLEGIDAPAEGTAEVDEQWDREWVRHHCRMALTTIRQTHDPQSVEVFERLLAGEEPENVAAARGISLDAVLKIKQRVRARLRELVSEQIREEDRE